MKQSNAIRLRAKALEDSLGANRGDNAKQGHANEAFSTNDEQEPPGEDAKKGASGSASPSSASTASSPTNSAERQRRHGHRQPHLLHHLGEPRVRLSEGSLSSTQNHVDVRVNHTRDAAVMARPSVRDVGSEVDEKRLQRANVYNLANGDFAKKAVQFSHGNEDTRRSSTASSSSVASSVAASEVSSSTSSSSSSSSSDTSGHDRPEFPPIEFLMSCIAMSVGLGNVWRFPFTAYENGGGAFLIPYLIVLTFIGRPLYFLELAMGQFCSRSSIKVWDMCPAVRGIGYGQAIATSSVVSYYTSLIALSVYYLVASFAWNLPWTYCHEDIYIEGTVCIGAGTNFSEPLPDDIRNMSAAEQFFMHKVLKSKGDIADGVGIPDAYLVGCMTATYLMLFLILFKGVASSGKASYFTALFPYVVLITLLGRGVTLPGAIDGIMFYITPDWEKLLEVKVWYAAVTQSFFSLSVGFGSLISYASYNRFNHHIYRDALIISVIDTFTSLLAGFAIFSILGNLALEMGVDVDKVVQSGAALAFISYPMAIAKFDVDYMPQIFSVLFFLMLITLGLGSATGLMSGVISVIHENHPKWNKTWITLFICISGFLIGLVYVTPGGQHILNLVDYFGGGFIIFALAVIEVVAVSWIYGMRRFIRDITFMLDISVGIYWKFCWGFFIPVSLIAIFVYALYSFERLKFAGVPYPDEAMYAGWALTALACIQVPAWAMYAIIMSKEKTFLKKIRDAWSPNEQWGPKHKGARIAWVRLEAERNMKIPADGHHGHKQHP